MRVSALAHRLVGLGLRNEDRVAISLPRSIDMLVAMLGTLGAGGAYVPLDPTHPPARLAHILEVARRRSCLTCRALVGAIPAGSARVICLDELDHEEASADARRPEPGQLAYVIFTSGSTGLPKGVEVTHGALANLLASMAKEPGIAAATA